MPFFSFNLIVSICTPASFPHDNPFMDIKLSVLEPAERKDYLKHKSRSGLSIFNNPLNGDILSSTVF